MALAGRYFNIIALAALTTKLTIVDNMLMQRATSTTNAQDPPFNISTVNLWANESIPVTGAVGGRSGAGELLTTEFNIDLFGKLGTNLFSLSASSTWLCNLHL